MLSLLGRLITFLGCVMIVYSLFQPIYVDELPTQPQEMGGIVIDIPIEFEVSLFNLGEKLEEAGDSVRDVPPVLNYLWLIFLGLAVLNFFVVLSAGFPKLLRLLCAATPLGLLVMAIYQTSSNPNLGISFSELYGSFTDGFYILLAGSVAVIFGVFLTRSKQSRRK
jgi:hypothetical protein